MRHAGTAPMPTASHLHHRWYSVRVKSLTSSVLCVLLLGLGACAVGPDYTPPAPAALGVPPAFETAPAAPTPANLSHWWAGLDDPVLMGLVEAALANSPDLAQARARLKAAQARQGVAQAGLFPTVSASGSATSGGTGSATSDSYEGALGISWLADLFGEQRRTLEAATADTEATTASLGAVQVALVANVATAYGDWRSAGQRLALARRTLATQRETFRLVRWQAQAGLTSQLITEQADTAAAQTEAQIPSLETARAEAAHRLAVLVGKAPGTITALLTESKGPHLPDKLTVGIPANVLRQRPDVQQAERQLAAATARIGGAEAALYPSLTLRGSIGLDALDLPDLVRGGAVTRSLAGSIAATIFDAGALRQQVTIRTAEQEEALAAYQATLLGALEEIENALVTTARLRERVTSLTHAATAARRAEELAHAQYRAGLSDYRDVLDTERTRLSADDALTVAQADTFSALVTLYQALGGGWTYGAPSP